MWSTPHARLSRRGASADHLTSLCASGHMGAELEAPLMGAAAAMGTPVRGAVFVLTNTILGAGIRRSATPSSPAEDSPHNAQHDDSRLRRRRTQLIDTPQGEMST